MAGNDPFDLNAGLKSNPSQLIDKRLASAYAVVEFVKEHFEEIKHIGQFLADNQLVTRSVKVPMGQTAPPLTINLFKGKLIGVDQDGKFLPVLYGGGGGIGSGGIDHDGTPLGDVLRDRIEQLDQTAAELHVHALELAAEIETRAAQFQEQALAISEQAQQLIAQATSTENLDAALADLRGEFETLGAVVDAFEQLTADGQAAAQALVLAESEARVDGDNALAATISLIGAKSGDGTAFVLDLTKVKVGQFESLASRLSTISSEYQNALALIQQEASSRATDMEAEASARESLGVEIMNATGAAVATEASARVAGDQAEATARQSLAATLRNETEEAVETVTASVTAEQAARIAGDEAEATAREALAATLTGDLGDVTAMVEAEQAARIDGDEAEASARTALAATLRAETAAFVEAEESARVTADEAEAEARETLGATLRQEQAEAITAGITTEAAARVAGDQAEATARTAVVATLRAETAAFIEAEQTARSTADAAEVTARTNLATALRAETAAYILTEQNARSSADGALATTLSLLGAKTPDGSAFVLDDVKVKLSNGTALSTTLSGLLTRMGTAEGAITTEQTTRANADTALANRATALETSVGHATTGLAAAHSRITTEESTRSTADAALGNRATTLETAVNHSTTGLAAAHTRITTEEGARATADTALGNRATALETTVNNPTTGVAAAHTRITTEETARTNADSALGTRATNLETTVNHATTGVAAAHSRITTEETTRSSADTALSNRATALESTVNHGTIGVNATAARLTTEETTRANADTALGTRATNLETTVNHGTTGVAATAARLTTEETTRANAVTALGNRATALEATVNSGTDGNTALKARIATEETTRANADTALATRATSLESRTGQLGTLSNTNVIGQGNRFIDGSYDLLPLDLYQYPDGGYNYVSWKNGGNGGGRYIRIDVIGGNRMSDRRRSFVATAASMTLSIDMRDSGLAGSWGAAGFPNVPHPITFALATSPGGSWVNLSPSIGVSLGAGWTRKSHTFNGLTIGQRYWLIMQPSYYGGSRQVDIDNLMMVAGDAPSVFMEHRNDRRLRYQGENLLEMAFWGDNGSLRSDNSAPGLWQGAYQGIYVGTGPTVDFVYAEGPDGAYEWIMRSTADGGNSNYYDGGIYNWTVDDDSGFDPFKPLLATVYIRREDLSSPYAYCGCQGYATLNLNGTENDNPYFLASRWPDNDGISTDWFLWVGLIHPAGYTGGDIGVSGIYNPRTGQRLFDGDEFKSRINLHDSGGYRGQCIRIFGYGDYPAGKKTYLARPCLRNVLDPKAELRKMLATVGSPLGSLIGGQPVATVLSDITSAHSRITTEETARTTADSALATRATNLETTVGGHTASISTQQTSINGLQLRYSLTLNSNGHVTGWTLNNNGATGTMDVVVDKFRVMTPGGAGSAPFEISDGVVRMNGVRITPGTITADRLNVTTLSALTANVGLLRTATTGARQEIEANQIRIYDAGNVMRVRLGVW